MRDVFAVSTGAMFSSGFFLLPGLAAAYTGASAALAYLAAAVLALPALFTVAELSTAMPRAGGAYFFLDRGLGPAAGTVGGIGSWLALVLKSAFALVGMGAYLALFVDMPIKPLALSLVAAFAAVNIVGAKESAGFQLVLVAVLVAVLTFFVSAGLIGAVGGPGALVPLSELEFATGGLTGFVTTIGLVFVSYAGLTKVASIAEEVRDPDRNLPLGMVLSLATATAVYCLGVWVITMYVPPTELVVDLTPVASAAAGMGGGFWAVILVVVAAFAAFASTANAGLMASARYPLAMARDGLVPKSLDQIGRFGTPTRGVLLTAAAMAFFVAVLDVAALAKLASAIQLALFALLHVAVLVMRHSGLRFYRPGFRSPWYPWTQIVGIATCLWLIAGLGTGPVLATVGVFAAALLWYRFYAQGRVVRSGAILHVLERLGAGADKGLDYELRTILNERIPADDASLDAILRAAPIIDSDAATDLRSLLGGAVDALGLERHRGIDADQIVEQLSRDAFDGLMPIARGAAVSHARVMGLAEPMLVAVRVRSGVVVDLDPSVTHITWRGPVQAVLVVLSPADEHESHLRLLARLAGRVDDPGFMPRWLESAAHAELRLVLLGEELPTRQGAHALSQLVTAG